MVEGRGHTAWLLQALFRSHEWPAFCRWRWLQLIGRRGAMSDLLGLALHSGFEWKIKDYCTVQTYGTTYAELHSTQQTFVGPSISIFLVQLQQSSTGARTQGPPVLFRPRRVGRHTLWAEKGWSGGPPTRPPLLYQWTPPFNNLVVLLQSKLYEVWLFFSP